MERPKNKYSITDFDLEKGVLSNARYVSSPNYDDRPTNVSIDAIVIHAISLPPGKYNGNYVEQFFCNQLDREEHPYFAEIAELRVSSHFFIKRSGELVQFVPVNKRAWHAGASFCMRREAVNDFSIGIELEGCDEDDFAMAQYQTLFALTSSLLSAIPTLSAEHIYGHADISPGRKTDPGPGFDWEAYRLALSTQGFRVASKDIDDL